MHTQFIYINTYMHTMHIIHPCIGLYVMIGRTKNAVHYTHACMQTYRSKYTQKCAGKRVYNPKCIHVSLAFGSSMYEGDFELNHARIICFRLIVESLQTDLIFFIHSQKTLCNMKRINRQATRSFSHAVLKTLRLIKALYDCRTFANDRSMCSVRLTVAKVKSSERRFLC